MPTYIIAHISVFMLFSDVNCTDKLDEKVAVSDCYILTTYVSMYVPNARHLYPRFLLFLPKKVVWLLFKSLGIYV